MNDIETIADRNIESAVKHARLADGHKFVAGYQAAKVYGLYQEAATNEIARQSGRSVSAVKNWVHAYRCFASCLAVNYELAKTLRRELSMTHFQVMYDLGEKYSLHPETQIFQLAMIWNYKNTGDTYGPDVLRQEIEAATPDQRAASWKWHLTRILGDDGKNMERLLSFDGELPDRVKRWARLGYKYQRYLR